jgi:DNA-binding NarL/FixJ family response regulator
MSDDPATEGLTTVLIVDDHPEVLDSVREIIETDATLAVVGSAGGVQEAIRIGRDTQPQVAVLDVNMPQGGGWEAAKGLLEVCPSIRMVAYSSFDNPLIKRTIAAAGVSAFVSKGSDIGLLLAAIHGEDVSAPAPPPKPLFAKSTAVSPDATA